MTEVQIQGAQTSAGAVMTNAELLEELQKLRVANSSLKEELAKRSTSETGPPESAKDAPTQKPCLTNGHSQHLKKILRNEAQIFTKIEDLPPKQPGVARMYCAVCFDLFHFGHVNFLRQMYTHARKEIPDNIRIEMIIGMHPDKEIESYKRTPVCTWQERANVAKSCVFIDYIVPVPVISTSKMTDSMEIDIVYTGSDYTREFLLGTYPCIQTTKHKALNYTMGISTTDLIKRLRSRDDKTFSPKKPEDNSGTADEKQSNL